jgi:hypothetical protein
MPQILQKLRGNVRFGVFLFFAATCGRISASRFGGRFLLSAPRAKSVFLFLQRRLIHDNKSAVVLFLERFPERSLAIQWTADDNRLGRRPVGCGVHCAG